MHYNIQRKLAFVMPPRTGTTTFARLLSKWGAITVKGFHPKPNEAQIDNFNQYVVYGFFRNPLDRFLSLLRYIRENKIMFTLFYSDCGISHEEFKQMNYNQMLDAFPKYYSVLPKFFDPQISWLENATTLNFNNYTAEILRVARMFDITQVNLEINNQTKKTTEIPSQRIIDFVQTKYANDYCLGRERGLLT